MRRLRRCIFVMFLTAIVAGSAWSQGARIPLTHAASLSGDTVNLPEALHGKAAVLVLGFSRGSRVAVTEWGRRLAGEYRGSPTVLYYEMPVLASVPRLLRGFVVRAMKATVPERAQSRFVPLMANEAAWRALVHYSNADDAYVLVVDGNGRVRWVTKGSATDAAMSAVKQHIESVAK